MFIMRGSEHMLSEEQSSLLNRLIIAEKYFGKVYSVHVDAAKQLYEEGDYDSFLLRNSFLMN